jgi:hypothetical protein
MLAITQIIKSKSFTSLIGNGLFAALEVVIFLILASYLPIHIFFPYLILIAIYGILKRQELAPSFNCFFLQQPSLQILNNY